MPYVHRVDAEAVDALAQPELHRRLVDGRPRPRVLPVEVRLLRGEQVQVVLLGGLVPVPGGAAEVAAPVVGRPAGAVGVVLGRPPHVPVALGVVLGGAALLEPLVLVAGVVDDEVEQHAQAARVAGFDDALHVPDRAVGRVHLLVVGDVVAHVVLRAVVPAGIVRHGSKGG